MDTIYAAPASSDVRAAIRFLHERQSAAEIHRRLCRVYGDTVMSEMLHKLRTSIQNKRHRMLTKGAVLLQDNARPHTAARINALIKCFNREIFTHPPYSQDLAPNDYHLFSKMVWLATEHFHSNEERMDGVTACTSHMAGAA
jgi:arsenate reductase-like glutaredoxin family protein